MGEQIHAPSDLSDSDSDYVSAVEHDLAAEDADLTFEQESDGTSAAATATEEESGFEYGNDQDALIDSIDRKHHPGPDESSYCMVTSSLAHSPPPHLSAIEVVLRPPADPDSYQRITLSSTMSDVDYTDESSHDAGFRDDLTEFTTYDSDLRRKDRRTAVQASKQAYNLNSIMMGRNSNKRLRSEDAYEESDSEFEIIAKRRKPLEASNARNTRRSSRKAPHRVSRQASASLNPNETESDEPKSQHINLAEGDSDEEIIWSAPKGRRAVASSRKGRQARSRNFFARNSATAAGSDDELAQDHDDDEDDDLDFVPIVRSDLAQQQSPRNSKRKRKTRGASVRTRVVTITKRDDSDSSIEFEETRRSTRTNKNSKNMKEPELDEYDAVEEKKTNPRRYTSIKETFQLLDPDSQFRRMHSESCATCSAESGGPKNPLIHCQGCSFSYHKACLGPQTLRECRVTKIGHDDFVLQCRFCVQARKKKGVRVPNHTICQTCKIPGSSCAEFSSQKTPKQEEKARMDNNGIDPIARVDPLLVNNADNVLFRCISCKRAYHFEHLPELIAEMAADQSQDLKTNRLAEYSMAEWNCKDCTNIKRKLHSLVTWRPVDRAMYVEGQTNEDYEEDDIEYLVQWEGRSHFHDTWMPGAWVFGVAAGSMRLAFHKRESSTYPKMDKATAIEEEWLLPDVLLDVKYRTRISTSDKEEDLERIDDITSVYVKFQGLSYEEVVWDEPPPRDSGAPWEAFIAAYDEYLNGKYFVTVSDHRMRERIALYRSLDFAKDCELKSQPAQLKKGKLMGYQMEGVNFLLYNFHQQQNVILADEMGLGKTIQIVAFISALAQSQPCCWPFLAVVPNATCPNWRRELKQWAPDLRVVTYHGGKVAQDLAYKHELYPDGRAGGMKAHVVIMSYEAAANVNNVFRGVRWVGLIVDEGQRLKNEETLLYKSLRDMNIPCRILLTGTPLQNNKRELFTLLQFIDTERNAEELDAKYAQLTKDNLPELHSLIRPYFLRRTKRQVLKFLPPMAQIILPVTMTVLQEKLSKSIMARNPDLIRAIMSKSRLKAGERKSMNNIMMDLRQCLCHPFCFNGDVEDRTVDAVQMYRNLIEASPKLLLLELMLPKLKERGHRVLIFSQFLHCLTILEDFLTGMNLAHSRIDGGVSALEKQKRIDAYNAPDSPLFVMLLSTRAGGVGINLATADTVIIYDPDFNPHQDIQALSRAHRIGQKRKVLCFQLMTKGTVEEKIMQVGRKKMALDHALIEKMDANEEVSEDLESILRHGAAALFGDGDKDKITYDDTSVDELLDRSQIENTDTGDDDSAETQFSFARVWTTDKGELASNTEDTEESISSEARTSIWEHILKQREAEHEREIAAKRQVYGRGARRLGTRDTERVNYKTGRLQDAGSGGSEVDIDDELYIDQHELEEDDDNSEEDFVDEATDAKLVGSGNPRAAKGKKSNFGNQTTEEKSVSSDNPKAAKGKKSNFGNQTTEEKSVSSDNPKAAKATVHNTPQPLQSARIRSGSAVLKPSRNARSKPDPGPFPWQSTLPPTTQPLRLHAQPQAPQVMLNVVTPSEWTVDHNYYPRAPRHPPLPVQLPSGYIAPEGMIGGGNPCALCFRQHSVTSPCVNLNSELSLRMALDRLRLGAEPEVRDARNFFLMRLHMVSARGLTGQ